VRPALLDVNVLIALLDREHVDHRRASTWLKTYLVHGWATCPLTENGFVRVLSSPRYPNPVPPVQGVALLARATAGPEHEFWPDEVSLLDSSVIAAERVHGPRQVTDAYLLALAVARGGRLVTFDRRLDLQAVPGADQDSLYVL
jgi:toxin-antitoxin system PIN domain toxin